MSILEVLEPRTFNPVGARVIRGYASPQDPEKPTLEEELEERRWSKRRPDMDKRIKKRNERQARVIELLKTGKFSVEDICLKLGMSQGTTKRDLIDLRKSKAVRYTRVKKPDTGHFMYLHWVRA